MSGVEGALPLPRITSIFGGEGVVDAGDDGECGAAMRLCMAMSSSVEIAYW